MPIDRRRFVAGLASLAGAAAFTRGARAAATAAPRLKLYHLHTSEQLDVVYRENGSLVPDALAAVERFLRDFRTGERHGIDVALLDDLARLHAAFDGRGRFEVISGYRSPQTNEALRHATSGVAKASLHLSGRAIDVRLTSAPTDRLRDAAIALRAGGVGYYPDSNFVHVDTGRFRTW